MTVNTVVPMPDSSWLAGFTHVSFGGAGALCAQHTPVNKGPDGWRIAPWHGPCNVRPAASVPMRPRVEMRT